MQKYNSDKDDFMAVKLNTNKAYDKVEWGILGVGDEKDEFYWEMDKTYHGVREDCFLFYRRAKGID